MQLDREPRCEGRGSRYRQRSGEDHGGAKAEEISRQMMIFKGFSWVIHWLCTDYTPIIHWLCYVVLCCAMLYYVFLAVLLVFLDVYWYWCLYHVIGDSCNMFCPVNDVLYIVSHLLMFIDVYYYIVLYHIIDAYLRIIMITICNIYIYILSDQDSRQWNGR